MRCADISQVTGFILGFVLGDRGRLGGSRAGVSGERGKIGRFDEVSGDNVMASIDVQIESLGLSIQCFKRTFVSWRKRSTLLTVAQENICA